MTRPPVLVFVSGTGTEVGKTWWTARLATALRARGTTVSVRKPVQSIEPGATPESEVLAAATGEEPDAVCSPARTYPVAWAPPMAAAQLGRAPFTIADLAAELTWPPMAAVGLVEGAGGARSPIASDGDNVDLAVALAPDLVLVVADAGLGAINAVRLTVDAYGSIPTVVALNRFHDDPLHARNREHLANRCGLDVVVDPTALAARF